MKKLDDLFSCISSFFSTRASIHPLPYSRLIIFDGDQSINPIMKVHDKIISKIPKDKVRIEFVKMHYIGESPPKILKKFPHINFVPLSGFSAKKEVVDKWIGIRIQQAIDAGCQQISVVSSDFDFVDIFRMILMMNPTKKNLNFTLIAPKPIGKLNAAIGQDAVFKNISIIKV